MNWGLSDRQILSFVRSATPLLGLLTLLQPACTARQEAQPSLAVLIAVDGLRGDLLERYDTLFSGGFRRLSEDGMRYTAATVDHGITVSHASHVTLATGLNPSRHGVVDAGFYVLGEDGVRTFADAVTDTTERIVGVPDAVGASPRMVLEPGIAEWLRTAHPEAVVAAVGSGQYSSLLHVFQPDAYVYWFMRSHGKYVTSTYYLDRYPDWVDRFNAEELPELVESSLVWEPLLDLSGLDLAREDAYEHEANGRHTAFPHRFDVEVPVEDRTDRRQWRWLSNTPYMDRATLALASEAVVELQLGQRGSTDYLAIVLSQVDNIAHWHGPLSHETLDVLLRLDRWLGELFSFLDQTVGEDRYVVGLSADHGMPNIPEYEAANGRPGYRVTAAMIDSLQSEVAGRARAGRANQIEAVLRAREYVADVYSTTELEATAERDTLLNLYRNSYHHDRIARLPLFSFSDGRSAIAEAGYMVRLVEGAVIDLDPAVHGSPYYYDRHVPLIFMGPGIGAGSSRQEAHTVDLAPTLAHLVGIPVPERLDGRILIR